MTNSGYDCSQSGSEKPRARLGIFGNGYGPVRFVDMLVPFSADALFSTVLDLYKWDQAVKAAS
jgi:hypothetical protein